VRESDRIERYAPYAYAAARAQQQQQQQRQQQQRQQQQGKATRRGKRWEKRRKWQGCF
jgi:hypothetical protein